MSRVLKALHGELESSGVKPGTTEYETELCARKVELCRQMRDVSSCWDCDYFDHCELIKAHLRDLYGVEKKK